jgi:hypothetical protein
VGGWEGKGEEGVIEQKGGGGRKMSACPIGHANLLEPVSVILIYYYMTRRWGRAGKKGWVKGGEGKIY